MLTEQQILDARKRLGIQEGGLQTTTSPGVERVSRLRKLREQRQPPQEKPGFFERAGSALKERAGEFKKTFGEVARGEIHPLEGSFRAIGDVAGGVGDVVGAALSPAVEKLAQTEAARPAFEALGRGMEAYEEWKNADEGNRRLAEVLEATANIADLAGMKGLTTLGKAGVKKVGKEAVELAGKVGKEGVELAEKGVGVAKKVAAAKPLTPQEALGQVLQGKTKDLKAGAKALSEINVEGIKTYDDLAKNIGTRIKELSGEVDADLAVDTTKRKLRELVEKTTTATGRVVKSKPVENALNHLKEVYSKTGDAVKEAELKDLIAKAKKEGLTNKEINDLARKYGSEFKKKAFGKTGEALTSINAQLYENTRKALKNFARQGIKGDAAKLADEATSNLYRLDDLIGKNVEKVNALKQRIQQRGLLEKVGHKAVKVVDVLSGGTLRGVMGGLLPRGVGNKLMNAIDIEEALETNLKIIKDALTSNSDDEIIKLLNKLNPDLK